MARIKKKRASGNAKNYITRSQAVRKLQVSLGDFRRLCIFKGIYPREPRSKKRVSKSATPSTTFYYAKDIQYLLHEPLLAKFRDQKALAKKISKALGRNEVGDAARLENNLAPKLTLDHIIKERYPTFVDALRDLDDALSMLFLFANLPSTAEVPAKMISKCQRLTMEFEHFLIRTHTLRKSFLSIKGIYYQATIQGQDILWLIPYKFVQRSGGDVDFRIMATFVEFYTTLLSFVNFRLYTSIGLVYPPKFDADSEEQGGELDAFQLEDQNGGSQRSHSFPSDTAANEKAQAEADQLLVSSSGIQQQPEQSLNVQSKDGKVDTAVDQPNGGLDEFAPIDKTADSLLQPSSTADSTVAGQLFEPLTFFLSRETPKHPLELLLKAFGCKRVGWDNITGERGSFCSESDPRVTHQIVDRPDLPLPSPPLTDGDAISDEDIDGIVAKPSNIRVPGRTYVQPQWVWDSINAGQLQRSDLYAPGATLPPHLSPWVKPRKGIYDPTVSLAEQETAAEAEQDGDDEEYFNDNDQEENATADEETDLTNAFAGGNEGEMTVELAGTEDEDDEEVAEEEAEGDWGGFSEDEDVTQQDVLTRKHQSELEAEALGKHVQSNASQNASKKRREFSEAERAKVEREAEEDIERRKMMMPRRKRKMYEKMVYSNARKDEEAAKLRAKRRKIENKLAAGSK